MVNHQGSLRFQIYTSQVPVPLICALPIPGNDGRGTEMVFRKSTVWRQASGMPNEPMNTPLRHYRRAGRGAMLDAWMVGFLSVYRKGPLCWIQQVELNSKRPWSLSMAFQMLQSPHPVQPEEEEDRKPTPNICPLTLHAFGHLTWETLGNSLCLCHHTRGNLLTVTIGYWETERREQGFSPRNRAWWAITGHTGADSADSSDPRTGQLQDVYSTNWRHPVPFCQSPSREQLNVQQDWIRAETLLIRSLKWLKLLIKIKDIKQ